MHAMLDICEKFAHDYDVKFNSLKSTVARIGERFGVECAPLTSDGFDLQYVQYFKNLGVHILSGKHFSSCVTNVQMKFYRTFNCIYY